MAVPTLGAAEMEASLLCQKKWWGGGDERSGLILHVLLGLTHVLEAKQQTFQILVLLKKKDLVSPQIAKIIIYGGRTINREKCTILYY